ncbi:MAG TPA: glycine cleavage system protein GcvH [Spirochaetota bacterium]|nr:glycine cleavage system protein GcvH [Spirochaetota bacterium]HPS86738.1 glycine cleavage system protein GcvH [Spirochaetota bacterium]
MTKEKGMNVPEDLLYTADHEWIRMTDDKNGVCGITDHAQHSLGDIVFVEFIANIVHSAVAQREPVVIIESPKAASDVYSPVKGTVLTVNRALEDAPEIINKDPYGEGWLFKLEIAEKKQLDTLLKPADYLKLIQEGD